MGKNPSVRLAEDKEARFGVRGQVLSDFVDGVVNIGGANLSEPPACGGGDVAVAVEDGENLADGDVGRVNGEVAVSLFALSLTRFEILWMPSQSFWSLSSVFS